MNSCQFNERKLKILNEEGVKNHRYENPYELESKTKVVIKEGIKKYDNFTRQYIFVKKVVLHNKKFMENVTNTLGMITKNKLKKYLKETEETELIKSKKVTDEFSWFLFEASWEVNGETFKIELLSMPIVITSHTNQNANAEANMTWNNCTIGTETILWTKLVDSIQSAHNGIIGINTLPLTTDQLNFLKNKAFRIDEKKESVESVESDDPHLTKNYFCIEVLEGYKFSFFNWFVGTSKFVKSRCRNLWNEGLILGYITINEGKELLEDQNSVPGMFLLRFSESQIGAITIMWVDEKREIQNQIPKTTQDIPNSLSLADIICGWTKLKQLYTPNGIIDKVVAFTPHLKCTVPSKPQYSNDLNASTNAPLSYDTNALNASMKSINFGNSSPNTTNVSKNLIDLENVSTINKDIEEQIMKDSFVDETFEELDEAMDTTEAANDSGCNSDSSSDSEHLSSSLDKNLKGSLKDLIILYLKNV